jgi:hypothetical protein
MGFVFRKRIRTSPHLTTNVSTHGVSESVHAGRVTVNSRGRATIRIARGLSFRFKL